MGVSRGKGEGGGGSGIPLPPLKNHENIGFLSNTGRDLPENHTATMPAQAVGPQSVYLQNAIKWHFAGRPMMARLSGI